MGFELRKYQKEAVDAAYKYLTGRSKKPGVIVAPTGCGKSILIGELVRRLGGNALILQPSKEILIQNYNKAVSFGMNPTIYSASCNKKELSPLTYATLKSVKSETESLKKLGVNKILVDECFAGDTEILTTNGFVKFKDLIGDETVAQYDKGEISFVKPKRFIKKEHHGDMISLKIRDKINVLVTPGHEFIFYNKTSGFKKERICDASFHGRKMMPVSGLSIVDDNGELSALERLYIAVQADGSIHKVYGSYVTISFSFKKERKIDRLIELCKESGLPISEVKCSRGKRRFMVKMPSGTSKDIRNHIKFPMSAEKANKVIYECALWDGSIARDSLLYYSSKDKDQVDFYNAVATIAGHSCYVSIEEDNRSSNFSDIYRLFVTKNKRFKSTQGFEKKHVNYDGYVYCVEVDSGSIVLRNNGYTFISGNCHLGYSAEKGSEFMNFVSGMGDVKVLGFTATPCRLHNYSSLAEGNYSKLNMLTKDDPRFFENIVHVTQIQELTRQGFWAKMKYEVWSFDERGLMLNSTGAEYTDDSIKRCIEKNGVNNGIYKRILQLMQTRKHILVCMDSIESCKIITDFINKKFGYICDMVTSKTTAKKREKVINDFKSGAIKVVFNYSALATGFDFPELDCVVMGRPTFSFSIYSQFAGRGVRPHPDKEDCLFVDCCNNYKRFGAIENVTVEHYPGRGWCMFSRDKLMTGVRLDVDVTRRMLEARIKNMAAGGVAPAENDARPSHPLENTIMPFGKYEGHSFKNIPISYFRWLIENMDKPDNKFVEYYNGVIL